MAKKKSGAKNIMGKTEIFNTGGAQHRPAGTKGSPVGTKRNAPKAKRDNKR